MIIGLSNASGGLLLLVMLGICISLVLISLLRLRQRPMNEFLRFLWALFIVIFPLIGSVAFLIVNPGTLEVGDNPAEHPCHGVEDVVKAAKEKQNLEKYLGQVSEQIDTGNRTTG